MAASSSIVRRPLARLVGIAQDGADDKQPPTGWNPRKRVRDLAFTAQRKLGELDNAAGYQVSYMLRDKDNPGWEEHFRDVHTEAEIAVRELIDANFAWGCPRQKKRAPG